MRAAKALARLRTCVTHQNLVHWPICILYEYFTYPFLEYSGPDSFHSFSFSAFPFVHFLEHCRILAQQDLLDRDLAKGCENPFLGITTRSLTDSISYHHVDQNVLPLLEVYCTRYTRNKVGEK